ncbi:MAG TPA: hypothetical protein VKB19_01700 [Pedobacter sp.]|nr:hypothetical protein [Pedobacter sp.]
MMNQADIFKKIGLILNELQDQYEFLARNPEQLNELELELFLANANFLSDHMEIVRKLNSSRSTKELPLHAGTSGEASAQIPEKTFGQEQQPVPERIPVMDDIAEPKDYTFFEKPADLVEYVAEESTASDHTFEFILNDRPESDQFDFEEKSVDAIFDRPLSADELQIIAEKQRLMEQRTAAIPDQVERKEVAEPTTSVVEAKTEQHTVSTPIPEKASELAKPVEFKPEPTVGKVEAKPVISALEPETQRPTLNDLLAGKSNTASREENAKPPINDLKGAINLNEKLLYIKDLFNGYNLAYSEAIELINKMPDMKTADGFLKNNYAEKNNWQAKQSTVEQFYELLNRRFPNG